MNRIDELLEKYFEAKTSLKEEQELKLYFNSGDVGENHKPYEALFALFEEERNVLYIENTKFSNKNRKWLKLSIITTAAASLIFAVVLIYLPKNRYAESYIVQNGVRYDDVQMAQNFAEQKIMNVSEILNRSLEPIEYADKVLQESLQPLNQTENALEVVNRVKSPPTP